MAIQSEALVLEDDPLDRELLVGIFRTNGWRVHGFASAKDALDWMRDHPSRRRYRVALVDLKLAGKGMSGLEFIKTLGQFAPDIPCVIVTGDVGMLEVDLENLKIVMVVQKPFQESHFKQLLAKLKPQPWNT